MLGSRRWLLGSQLLLLACSSLTPASTASDRDLIGWSEDYKGGDGDAKAGPHRNPDELQAQQAPSTRRRGPEVLSWDPRIFLYRGILTDEECDHLVKKATPRLERSGVVNVDKHGSDISDIRTSYGMFFEREEDHIIAGIERRLSEWTMIPVGYGEGLQLLRYQNGQEYKPHFDYFFHEEGISNGGNRLATVLMYLADTEEGGETVFPNVKRPANQTKEAGFSDCAMEGMAVKSRKGDAVVFWSLRPDGTLDKGSEHGSCPVIKGTKYAATKWYHVAHYAMGGERAVTVKHIVFRPPPPPAPPGCVDDNTACPGWADGGECEDNPGFMVGVASNPGACLLSCGRCDLMRSAALGRKDLA